jgi:L-idonate 5-dehydrogenase
MTNMMKSAVLHGVKDIRIEAYQRPELLPGMVLLRNRTVGICGSDLHYYEQGRNGAFVPNRPFVLGHEFASEVAAVADDVDLVKVGDRVTANPARPCGFCEYCKAGRGNLCRKAIMLGSASTTPPTDGALAEFVMVRADQCHKLPDEIDDSLGAMIEPLAVVVHALKRAGSVAGKRVLVTGAGTIGLLAAITCRAFGAVPIAISDVVAARRAKAVELGVDAVLDPSAGDFGPQVKELAGDGFDLVFEASGAPRALQSAFDLVRPGGTILQVGMFGIDTIAIPADRIMAKEINYIGSMRYGNVFDEAIRLVAEGRVDVRPLINGVFKLDKSTEAFAFAGDKTLSFKVQIEI